ncbi:FAD-dependent oxidoreductase [Mangrovivirga sp. M17]|uniref:FAD-dependent oxidoreductase n=1 Tax=Mangrovivirga halotolerans TaxID=2993936 RepID=A0ABT3RM47_9BACT|nr:FAD-dependent oxidoreductase [Mangrovivirga halotolerans]MCX2742892.1 FAD-dependent oxidoreductase [Mangrovivirga halotolerans]
MSKDKKRILIIGQGLAGTVLALELLEKGQEVTVVSDPEIKGSSWAAGGIINPITGRKMVKTWNADELFPVLKEFYKFWEKKLECEFYHEKSIYRPFLELSDLNDWLAKYDNPEYLNYVEKVEKKPVLENKLVNPHGGLLLKNSGYLDIPVFLNNSHRYIKERGEVIKSEFNYQDIFHSKNHITWNGKEYDGVVFCRGAKEADSEIFGWLPFRPNKGELLNVKLNLDIEFGITRGKFLMPVKHGFFKLGATYDNHFDHEEKTSEAREKIIEDLKNFLKADPEVSDHFVGIRPATKDRKPIIGKHPKINNVFIFNGLGAKGVSLSPWCAKELSDQIIKNKPIDKRVNIDRFFSLLR